MRDWHHDRKADIGLRLCGIASCGVSYAAVRSLMTLRVGNGQLPPGSLPLLLAAVGFLCASAGATLLVLGRHIFDEVEICARWRAKPPADSAAAKTVNRADGKYAKNPQPTPFVKKRGDTRILDIIRRAWAYY